MPWGVAGGRNVDIVDIGIGFNSHARIRICIARYDEPGTIEVGSDCDDSRARAEIEDAQAGDDSSAPSQITRECDAAAPTKSPIGRVFNDGIHYGLGKRTDRKITIDEGELDGSITGNANTSIWPSGSVVSNRVCNAATDIVSANVALARRASALYRKPG